jgi:hypothetical protein
VLGPSHWLHEIFSSQKTWSPFLAWANTPCKEYPTYSVWGTFDFFLKTAWFSNISDPETCQFWIDQKLKRTASFQRRMRDYLTASNSPTIQPKLKELGIGF